MGLIELPREKIGLFPTPINDLKRLSKALDGPRILMKRDDQTGLAFGGNKVRKLEYLIADAFRNGCDTLVTGGAAQSNHCRQTAAAAAALGLSCHLVLGGEPPDIPDGNLLIDILVGATIHWTGPLRKGESIPEIADELSSSGDKPYIIPYGGSNSIGSAGFVNAVSELKQQIMDRGEKVDYVVFASSSGGTQAGLTVGKIAYDLSAQLIGIGVDKDTFGHASFEDQLTGIANDTAERLGLDANFSLSDFIVKHEYMEKGYGVVGSLEREAISLTAENEGILLDPVYTGRAMGGLMDMIRNKEFTKNETVLFWHTGGTPAIFSYAQSLMAAGT